MNIGDIVVTAHSNNNLIASAVKNNFVFSPSITTFARTVSDKQYELKDHLGNVRVTVSDIKHPVYSTGSPVVLLGFTADLRSVMNYYSFGMDRINTHNMKPIDLEVRLIQQTLNITTHFYSDLNNSIYHMF